MIGSGGGPVAAECGPTGYNFSKGMAGQGRATGQGRAGQGRAPLGRAGRVASDSQGGARDCLDPRGQAKPFGNAWRLGQGNLKGHRLRCWGSSAATVAPAPEPASLTPRHARCCYSQRPQLASV